jgi:hypothetical protein
MIGEVRVEAEFIDTVVAAQSSVQECSRSVNARYHCGSTIRATARLP